MRLGQLHADGERLHGIGRKLDTGYGGFIEEGSFNDNQLIGFGRRMTTIGFLRMGYHKNEVLHGYGKRVLAHGAIEEGLFENGEYKD